ncbi:MAG: hypothetical protein R3E91_01065 [Chlamydiales bacterium]
MVAIVGLFVLCSGLGHIATIGGLAIFFIGVSALVGLAIKCIKKPQAPIEQSFKLDEDQTVKTEVKRVPTKVIEQFLTLDEEGNTVWINDDKKAIVSFGEENKPLVVPKFREANGASPEAVKQFLALHEGDTVWVGEDKKPIKIGNCLDTGGSKRPLEIPEGLVLMLPNKGHSLKSWQRVVDEEVQISDKLIELGILTVKSERVDIFLSEDSDQSFPAYRCPSFKSLEKKDMYVIDKKKTDTLYLDIKEIFFPKRRRSVRCQKLDSHYQSHCTRYIYSC